MKGSRKINRRGFLKLAAAGVCASMLPFPPREGAADPISNPLFWIKNVPEELQGNYHAGVDRLLELMGSQGLKFYRSSQESALSGSSGMIEADDVVLIKVNAQWKYRGCTNSDLIRGLIQKILDHPDGFRGEVVIFENGQGRGSLRCDTSSNYPDALVHANANDESHSFVYVVNAIFNDDRVSAYLLDPIRATFIENDDHVTDGYRIYENVSYPCFTTAGGRRVELREGLWEGSGHTQKLKLINVPVLKHHDEGGSEITASLKLCYGILSMSDGQSPYRHYDGLGNTCGKMVVSVRTPVLHVIDATWVSYASLAGYPPATTRRLNQILASQDPVALDYWAAKYVLYPINNNYRHAPSFAGIDRWLTDARNTINERGGLYNPEDGISIHRVTKNEARMQVFVSSITVNLQNPAGGEAIPSGSTYTVRWDASLPATKFRLFYSTDNGETWASMNPPPDFLTGSSYDWIVPAPPGNRRRCLVKLVGYDDSGRKAGQCRSETPFTIEVVRLISPNGGTALRSDDPVAVTWSIFETTEPIRKVKLYYTKNGGARWNLIQVLRDTYAPGEYSHPWTVPRFGSTPKERCKVKVVVQGAGGIARGSDVSDGEFTINP